VISIRVEGRNGDVVAASLVEPDHEVMLISDGGTLIRTKVSEISMLGRNTQGVRLINLGEEEKLLAISRIDDPEDEEGDADDAEPAAAADDSATADDAGDDAGADAAEADDAPDEGDADAPDSDDS